MENAYTRINSILNTKVPRWDELPDFEVYNDQLVSIVENVCRPFYSEGEKIITPSMINNYVKWGVLHKPNKKKYRRSHIACCIVLTMLKGFMSINDINMGIVLQVKALGYEKAYDEFCMIIENGIQDIFGNYVEIIKNFGNEESMVIERKSITIENHSTEKLMVALVTEALCSKILTEIILVNKGRLKLEEYEEDGGEYEQ